MAPRKLSAATLRAARAVSDPCKESIQLSGVDTLASASSVFETRRGVRAPVASTSQARMQRIVLALVLTGAAGLVAPQCAVRAPRAGLLRAEAAEAPAEATPTPTFKVIDIPSDKWTAAQKQEKTALETAAPPASTSPPEAPKH